MKEKSKNHHTGCSPTQKNIDVKIPRDKFAVITGLSGSDNHR